MKAAAAGILAYLQDTPAGRSRAASPRPLCIGSGPASGGPFRMQPFSDLDPALLGVDRRGASERARRIAMRHHPQGQPVPHRSDRRAGRPRRLPHLRQHRARHGNGPVRLLRQPEQRRVHRLRRRDRGGRRPRPAQRSPPRVLICQRFRYPRRRASRPWRPDASRRLARQHPRSARISTACRTGIRACAPSTSCGARRAPSR